MRILVAGLAAALALVCARPADACGIPPVSDVTPQQDATSLLTLATQLESQAATSDANAVAADRQATMLTARGREMRVLAARAIDPDRSRLLARAFALEAQAAQSRAQAAQMRERAANLRVQAIDLRARAAKLAGGGWRGRPQPTA